MKAGASHRAAGWLIAGAIAVAGCRGAEAFPSNIFISEGSGGASTGGGAGGDVIVGSGSGGAGSDDDGGVTGSGGAPPLDGGPSDADQSSDVAAPPDAPLDLAREVRLPEGPFTPVDCIPLAPYKPDDQAYGPGTTIFSLRDLRVYRCMQGLQSGWCTIGAYEPGLDIGYWRDCWIPIGYCQ